MRKVVAGLFITLDGVTERPDQWQETFDEDMGAEFASFMPGVDAMLLGRITYQEWAAYWPAYPDDGPDADYAQMINQLPKYVVSSTLEEVSWGKFDTVSLIKDNLAEEIGKLKQQPGKNIAVQGSPTLVNSLIQHDLLDELSLYIHNVAAYDGRRLFSQGALKRMDLLEAKPSRSGVVIAKYQPRKA